MNVFVFNAPTDEAFLDLTEATGFFARVLLSERKLRSVNLHVLIEPELQEEAYCSKLSDTDYLIELRAGPEDDNPIKSLAHEIVHFKQMHCGEFCDEIEIINGVPHVIWKGNPAPIYQDVRYFDSDWEIEAYGREPGLYARWTEHKENC